MGWEDPLEKGKATHSSILAWRFPRTVWSIGSQRVRHNSVTNTAVTMSDDFLNPQGRLTEWHYFEKEVEEELVIIP